MPEATTFNLKITERTGATIVVPSNKGGIIGWKRIDDATPMVVQYVDAAQAIGQAAQLGREQLLKHPDAQVELPDGQKMALAEWVKLCANQGEAIKLLLRENEPQAAPVTFADQIADHTTQAKATEIVAPVEPAPVQETPGT